MLKSFSYIWLFHLCSDTSFSRKKVLITTQECNIIIKITKTTELNMSTLSLLKNASSFTSSSAFDIERFVVFVVNDKAVYFTKKLVLMC